MNFEYCTKEQMLEFFAEFNATEESVKRDVNYVMEWLRQQPHLPNVQDEKFLTNVLLRCKNSLEKTKHTLDNYYRIKAARPDIFLNRNVLSKEYKEQILNGSWTTLRKLTAQGYRVVVYRPTEESADFVLDLITSLRMRYISNDISTKTDVVRGQIFILDFLEMTKAQVAMLLQTLLKSATLPKIPDIPLRIRKIYALNVSTLIEPLLKLCKQMAKKSLGDKFCIWHEKETELAKVISKDVLPEIYGGNGMSLQEQKEIYLKEVQLYNDWFISEDKNVADLSKVQASNDECDNDSFGINGSFRNMYLGI